MTMHAAGADIAGNDEPLTACSFAAVVLAPPTCTAADSPCVRQLEI